MGKMSKEKGKRGEREVASMIRDYGFEARRGQQFSGGGGSPDVVHSIPGMHIEVKFTERLQLWPSLEQADDDAGDDMPVVFHRASTKPWVVIMHAADWLKFVRKATK